MITLEYTNVKLIDKILSSLVTNELSRLDE